MSTIKQYQAVFEKMPNCGFEDILEHEFFVQLAEKSRNVFWITGDGYNQQLYVSPAYEEIWGRSRETLIKNPTVWVNYLHPDDRVRIERKLQKRAVNRNALSEYDEHYRIIRPNGETRWIKESSFPVHNKMGECVGYAGIAEDITNDILYAENLKAEKERAERANQSKSDFIANMSHDLRTPLSGIIGVADILKKRISDPAIQPLIDGLSSASNTLLILVESILDYTQLEHGAIKPNLEEIELESLIRDLTLLYKEWVAEKGINLIVEYAHTAPTTIQSDIRFLNRILLNLLGNAVKFTHEGKIVIKVLPLNNGVSIIVEDTGIGIPNDKLECIYERFTRVERSDRSKYRGNGLGLAIVKQFVEALGGSIQVKSELNRGTAFTLNLGV